MWQSETHKRKCRFRVIDYSRKRDESGENKNDKDKAKYTHNSDVYIIYDDNFISLSCQDSIWIIDSYVTLKKNKRSKVKQRGRETEKEAKHT